MLVQIVRWLAILPSVILVHILVMFPIHWLVMYVHGGSESEAGILAQIPADQLEYGILALVAPMVWIIVSAKIAPKYKVQAGAGAAIMWAILFIYGLTLIVVKTTPIGLEWIRFGITVLLGLAGALLGLRHVFHEQTVQAAH